jgi:excisionase family DNA binding protein
MESMMTARQVAELLGVHENWVYDRAASGGLPSYKLGGARRFRQEEIEAWLRAQRQADQAPSRPAGPSRAPRATRGHHEQPRLFEQ